MLDFKKKHEIKISPIQKSLLAFVVLIAGLTLVMVPSITVQQASALHAESDPKADEKATKSFQKSEEKGLEGKFEQASKARDKTLKTCGGGITQLAGDTIHCTGNS